MALGAKFRERFPIYKLEDMMPLGRGVSDESFPLYHIPWSWRSCCITDLDTRWLACFGCEHGQWLARLWAMALSWQAFKKRGAGASDVQFRCRLYLFVSI